MKSLSLTLWMVLAPAGPLAAQEYNVIELDTSHAVDMGAAFRIAESGRIAGIGLPLGAEYPFATYWTEEGTFFLPNLPGDALGLAEDVSEDGVIVGESDRIEDLGTYIKVYPHATLWIHGAAVPLSSLVTSGPQDFVPWNARRINGRGQICGYGRYDNEPPAHAFFFDDGVVTDLGEALAWDMNEQGQVVGESPQSGFNHAVLWVHGDMEDLHDGSVLEGNFSRACGINEFGVIVGEARHSGVWETATLWDHGKIIDLGTLGGGHSMARDINDHGHVVGVSDLPGGGVHAFIHRHGTMEDLNDLIPPGSGWILANAHAVANDGRIVGDGFFSGSGPLPYLLEPDMDGGFAVYGAGCAGSGGFTPGLFGQGHPTSGGEVSVVLGNGLGQAPGLLLFGSGYGAAPFKPGCEIQILPLLPVQALIVLEGSGAGAGAWPFETVLPAGLPPSMVTLQALLVDPAGPGGFTVTNPLEMTIY